MVRNDTTRNHQDAPHGLAQDLDAPRDCVREIPWGGLALSGMALIAVSLVAFVMVTDESAAPQPTLAAPALIFAQRISVPDMARAPAMPRTTDDATSSIGRTIRTQPQVEARMSLSPAPDPRLAGRGPHGELPRIGRDGARPSDVYARPLTSGARMATGAPRLSIVLTGLGLDAALSARAVEALPGAVTLAFASYGENIEAQAEQARAAGHELLLQAPMEGFAQTHSAAPRTLAVNAPRERTLESLHWHMSRFPGYIGLTNLNGARFMSSAPAFAPVMQDIADRGLAFLDDGASPQSLAPGLAALRGAPSARADLVLDRAPGPEALDGALRQLEQLARERGFAIGVASVQPHSIDRIARFTQGLAARGVALAPVSALMSAPARTSAR